VDKKSQSHHFVRNRPGSDGGSNELFFSSAAQAVANEFVLAAVARLNGDLGG
jgi:hypothetical protein